MSIYEDYEDYNGWANYPTWEVYSWLSNIESSHCYCLDLAEEADTVAELADRLKDECVEAAPDLSTYAPMYSNLLGNALLCVDWEEIARYFFEEVGRGKE